MLKIKFNDGSEFIYHNQRFEVIDLSNLDKIALVSPAHRSQEGYAYISNKAPIRYSLHRYDENNLYHLVYSKSSYVLQAIFAPILEHKFQHTRTTEISSHSQSSFIHSGKQKIEDILNHAVEPYDKSKEYCIAIHWLNDNQLRIDIIGIVTKTYYYRQQGLDTYTGASSYLRSCYLIINTTFTDYSDLFQNAEIYSFDSDDFFRTYKDIQNINKNNVSNEDEYQTYSKKVNNLFKSFFKINTNRANQNCLITFSEYDKYISFIKKFIDRIFSSDVFQLELRGVSYDYLFGYEDSW